MESTESLLDQLSLEMRVLLDNSRLLLKLSKALRDNDINIEHANKVLSDNGFGSKSLRERFKISRIVRDIQKNVRERLLYSENENFNYTFLSYLLKSHHDLKIHYQVAANMRYTYSSLFDEINTLQDINQDNIVLFPFKNFAQLQILGCKLIIQINNLSQEFRKILCQEFCIKNEDVKKLFHFDTYYWCPIPLPQIKQLLIAPSDPPLPSGESTEFIDVLNKVAPASLNSTEPREIGIKVKWKGDLKQFAELLDILEIKGWIEPIGHGELNATIKVLTECFDFSLTQKRENSNSATSLMQYLKPSEREIKIYSKRYKKKFDSIMVNSTPK
jgi:hypothetical protein